MDVHTTLHYAVASSASQLTVLIDGRAVYLMFVYLLGCRVFAFEALSDYTRYMVSRLAFPRFLTGDWVLGKKRSSVDMRVRAQGRKG